MMKDLISFVKQTFCGVFTFERQVSPSIIMSGEVRFVQQNETVTQYIEKGVYLNHFDNATFFQNQTFDFSQGGLKVYKQTGDLLHSFVLQGKESYPLVLADTHHCGRDRYVITIVLRSPDAFQVQYDIHGHNKSYHIRTQMVRKRTHD